MAKPTTLDGYSEHYTLDCERVLVSLLRGLGPYKESVYLIGGLTPRYLVPARPPDIPAHVGTQDVDIVIDIQILTGTEAYYTLEENLKRMGFERAENDDGNLSKWRWKTKTELGARMIVELLTDAPHLAGGKVEPIQTDGKVSALNIPHSSMVFDLYEVKEVRAELLDANGIASEKVKHANLVSFTCLKLLAFDHRHERKDAHDLIYCIEYAQEGIEAVADAFRKERNGKHAEVITKSLEILRNRFASDGDIEGYRKDGPVAVAKFELGESDEPEQREARALRQRQVSDLIEQLLALIG
jgi:hypothetical protein